MNEIWIKALILEIEIMAKSIYIIINMIWWHLKESQDVMGLLTFILNYLMSWLGNFSLGTVCIPFKGIKPIII